MLPGWCVCATWQDMNAILQKMGCKKTKKQERYALRGELKELRKELRKREDQAVKEVMGHARVVLATNTGAADYALKHMEAAFDLVVIDEAAQALEVSCWIPMLRGRRVVLAGDHKQLAPTITSAEAAKRGLGLTLFDRVVGMYGASCTRMLNVQVHLPHAPVAPPWYPSPAPFPRLWEPISGRFPGTSLKKKAEKKKKKLINHP
ncbi:hypothetical protein CYMTET_35045 [Cymbomonas tetramitiformis]|uniref:DNA2/NAM7 helicase helicase domain-containing protein n=1 Tax=Cymbomonas tetramitiformis TaxID=36881 RepID=A0AAE0F9X7_9CHLO|nr:hypothetical protein CYMTET_35045 [Cymbomonas tetramitiformis]